MWGKVKVSRPFDLCQESRSDGRCRVVSILHCIIVDYQHHSVNSISYALQGSCTLKLPPVPASATLLF